MTATTLSTYAPNFRKPVTLSVSEVAFLAGVGAALPEELRSRRYAQMTTEERNAVVRHFRAAGVTSCDFPAVFARWVASGICAEAGR